MARTITAEETDVVKALVGNARAAMRAIDSYDQATVDRLCRAVAWAGGNEPTAIRLANMSVDESGMGRREPTRRAKVLGILRDALRQKSIGRHRRERRRGHRQVREAGRRHRLADSGHEPVRHADRHRDLRDQVQGRGDLLAASGEPEDDQRDRARDAGGAPEAGRAGRPAAVVERPSIPLANELMAQCDLTIATGGPAMVKAAYSSGKPAYGVGAGNATMVIDETANIEEAARNTRISKTNDNGSGCSADGNLLVDSSIYDAFLAPAAEGGRLPRQRGREGQAPGGLLGRRGPPHGRHDRAAGGGDCRQGRIHDPRRQDVLHRAGTADRQGAPVLDRKARRRARHLQVPRLRHGARHGPPDLRDRRQGDTPAASTRSTTSTSIGWRSSRR